MEDYELRNECEFENVFDFLTNHKVIINCEICICQIFSGSNTTANKGWFDDERPLQNAPFCPISVSGSNCNPQNTQCIPVVKIFAFLELEQN